MTATRSVGMAFRYTVNLAETVNRQQGALAASSVVGRFLVTEVTKIPRVAWLKLRPNGTRFDTHPVIHPEAVCQALTCHGVDVKPYRVDVDAFREHLAESDYPRYYAAGPIDDGGWREQKALEYFVSLDLLKIQPTDVVIDVASEWSVFPEIVQEQCGARVYRQDLIYPVGIEGDRIGGSADCMPVPDGFADKLVLHNSFEHFEGMADSRFIAEAWRVLKPGGALCILPLLIADEFSILSDPLVNRRNIVWDDGARVVEIPGWHNRFGRFYDVAALVERVLTPGKAFRTAVYHVGNVRDVHPDVYLWFALILEKPLVEEAATV